MLERRELWAQGLRTFVVTHAARRREPIGFLDIGADEQMRDCVLLCQRTRSA